MNLIASFTRFIRQRLTLPRLAALSLAAGLSSCGNVVYPLDPPALQARGLQPGEGYIVATFRSETVDRKGNPGSRGANATVIANGTGGAAKDTAACLVPQVMPVNRDPYLMGGGKPSEVIAIPVPAGDYEITRWTMTGSGSSVACAIPSPPRRSDLCRKLPCRRAHRPEPARLPDFRRWDDPRLERVCDRPRQDFQDLSLHQTGKHQEHQRPGDLPFRNEAHLG
jgi:hypothetical protein